MGKIGHDGDLAEFKNCSIIFENTIWENSNGIFKERLRHWRIKKLLSMKKILKIVD